MQKTRKATEGRRIAAEARQAEHDSLSLQDKIDKAVSRPGDSERELTRLYASAPSDWVNPDTGEAKG